MGSQINRVKPPNLVDTTNVLFHILSNAIRISATPVEVRLKSDRINELRKQYDSFLEEDKKRKERNEYILGKLDKMVYSNALVPARTKQTSIINRPPAMYNLPYQTEVSLASAALPSGVKQQFSHDIPVQKIDDTYLIQEVSKKYILIPKLTSPFINSYIQQAQSVCGIVQVVNGRQDTLNTNNVQKPSNDNSDWKSKYEILNILKKDETENQCVQFAPETLPETLLNNPSKKVYPRGDNVMTKDMNCNTHYKDLNELPEKDISDDKINYKLANNNDTADTTIVKPDPLAHNITDKVVDTVTNIGYEFQKTKLFDGIPTEAQGTNPSVDETSSVQYADDYNYIPHSDPTLASEQINYAENLSSGDTNEEYADYNYTEAGQHLASVNNPSAMLENKNLAEPKTEILTEPYKSGDVEKEIYVEEDNAESIQVISSSDLIKEIYNDPPVCDNGANDYVNYQPIQTGVDELTSNTDVRMKTSNDAVSEQTENVNAVDTPVEQRNPSEAVSELKDHEEAVDAVDIQDFDAEQKEMFYSEHPVEGYGYQQDDGNTINQEYQQQMETYQESETYPQNTNYYDGPLQQDVYPVDVEEDEEHLKLRYDQSYHQQYIDPYEQTYSKQPPEYQQSETYQPIQDDQIKAMYDEKTYENPDQIEAAMDNEQGFNEPMPGGVNIAPTEETNIPDSK